MPAKNVKIDVNVNVEKLYNGGTIDECCSLSDDNGGKTPTGNPEQFKTKVYKAKKVTWEAEKTGEKYYPGAKKSGKILFVENFSHPSKNLVILSRFFSPIR